MALLGTLLLLHAHTRADYKADIGFTKLQAELGATLPTGAGVTVTQVEAPETAAGQYLPNSTNPEFAGKTLTAKSGPAGVSGHATTVGLYYFGLGTGVAPGITTIDVYEANDWIQPGSLNVGDTVAPNSESRAIQSHSWIGDIDGGGPDDVNALRRFDFAIRRDGFLAVVGLNNGGAGVIPALLGHSYNGISVGRSDGIHSYGTTTVDGSGRTKPEIVAPLGATSYSTPVVASAAALLRQNAPVPARTNISLKALLMAGATKAQFPGWARTTTRPLDTIFGAGQLNVYNSYHILAAGQQPASTSVSVRPRGWDSSTTTAGGRRYFFDIPAGDTTPRLSVALIWNRTIADGLPGPDWGNPTSDLADLTLKIYTASGFTTGTLVDTSASPVDNVEHLYEPNLAPGRYVVEVTGSQNGVAYGLAWYSVPTVTIAATTPGAAEMGLVPGGFTVTRGGETTAALVVSYVITGTATNGTDCQSIPATLTIPAGANSATIAVTPLADTLAEGGETVVLTLASDPAYSVGLGSAATVTISDRPIDAWRFSRFTAAELANPALSGDLADFESDGITNLQEYALGLNPKISDRIGLPKPNLQPSGALALIYQRPTSTSDITYIAEVSNDLATWNSGPGYTATVLITGNEVQERWTVGSLLAPDPPGRQFIRLRVSRQ